MKKILNFWRELSGYLTPSNCTTLQYVTPAQGLRDAADALEKKEGDLYQFGALIRKLKGIPEPERPTVTVDWLNPPSLGM